MWERLDLSEVVDPSLFWVAGVPLVWLLIGQGVTSTS